MVGNSRSRAGVGGGSSCPSGSWGSDQQRRQNRLSAAPEGELLTSALLELHDSLPLPSPGSTALWHQLVRRTGRVHQSGHGGTHLHPGTWENGTHRGWTGGQPGLHCERLPQNEQHRGRRAHQNTKWTSGVLRGSQKEKPSPPRASAPHWEKERCKLASRGNWWANDGAALVTVSTRVKI